MCQSQIEANKQNNTLHIGKSDSLM